MDIDKLKARIDKAIEDVRSKGWRVQPGLWISPVQKCCCPIGALLISERTDKTTTDIWIEPVRLAAETLELTSDQVYSFVDGVDCNYADRSPLDIELCELGKKYRRALECSR